MGRGLGPVQRYILESLGTREYASLTLAEVARARAAGVNPREVARAALNQRLLAKTDPARWPVPPASSYEATRRAAYRLADRGLLTIDSGKPAFVGLSDAARVSRGWS